MIDISKQKIQIECPDCTKKLTVNLSQVARQEIINCIGCTQKIQLKDSGGSAKKGISDMNKAFNELEKTLKSFGK